MKLCFVDRSTQLKTVDDLKTKPRGGMVNSLFKITDYLATHGFQVWVLSDVKKEGVTSSGVKWVNDKSDSLVDFRQSFDVLIINRGTGSGYPEIKARHRVLWTHDLPHGGFIPDPRTIRAFSKTVFMSRYAERVWRAFYNTIGKSVLIPNGVDKKIFRPRHKDLNRIIYFSHPNRGLKRLPMIFDAIKTRVGRDIRLTAYCNAKKMYPTEGDMEEHGDQFDLLYESAELDGYEVKDPIPSNELAREVGRAGLCIMPTGYPEICSNSILQSLASGTPIITTGGMGSAPEWVRHRKNGALTTFQPADYMIHSVEIVREAVRILEDETMHRSMIENAAKTKIYSWEEIGQKWAKMLKRLG